VHLAVSRRSAIVAAQLAAVGQLLAWSCRGARLVEEKSEPGHIEILGGAQQVDQVFARAAR
jgi:hypothetical protein